MWNKALQIYAVMGIDHPFAAVRVREILKWGNSQEYINIKTNLNETAESACPNCHKPISESWAYCRHCGTKLK